MDLGVEMDKDSGIKVYGDSRGSLVGTAVSTRPSNFSWEKTVSTIGARSGGPFRLDSPVPTDTGTYTYPPKK
jgi:hypothetical protein